MSMLLPSQQKLTLSLACRHNTLALILAGQASGHGALRRKKIHPQTKLPNPPPWISNGASLSAVIKLVFLCPRYAAGWPVALRWAHTPFEVDLLFNFNQGIQLPSSSHPSQGLMGLTVLPPTARPWNRLVLVYRLPVADLLIWSDMKSMIFSS